MEQYRRSSSRRKILTRVRQVLGLAIVVVLVMAVTVVGESPANPSLRDLLHLALIGAGEGIALLVMIFVLYRVLSQAARRR